MMENIFLRTFFGAVVLIQTTFVSPARILSLPQNINSHVIDHGRMARAMAAAGHEVTMVIPSNIKVPDVVQNVSRIQIIHYQTPISVPFVSSKESSEHIMKVALAKSAYQKIMSLKAFGEKFLRAWQKECDVLMNSKVVKEHLDTNKYDLVLGDNAALDCQMVIPVAYDIPYIMFGISSFSLGYRIPSLPSFVPHFFSSFSDEMSFMERFQNTLMHGMSYLMMKKNMTLYERYAPSKNISDSIEVYRKSSLFFVLDDPALSYPHPTMPNFLFVGDLIPQTPKPLPPHVLDFVESAEAGVIIVSFGSYFDYIPADLAAKFCRAFQRLPQRVIWKLKSPELCKGNPDKLMLLNWLPQNDLLSHDNVKLFISHCGMNSVIESIYHEVPILGMPLTIDQPYNAQRIQNLKQGIHMHLNDFTEDELVAKTQEIINSDEIRRNVRKASSLMKNRPIKPEDHVSYWVDHLVKYGDQHLRTAAYKLNDAQFLMIDVFFVMFVIVIVATLLLFTLIWCSCRCARKLLKKCKVTAKPKTA